MVDSWMGVFACPTNATRAIGFSNAIAVDSLVKLCDSAQQDRLAIDIKLRL